eukprot:SAG31_NODE_70_length_28117_cov_100.521843_30_plen_80_part_00
MRLSISCAANVACRSTSTVQPSGKAVRVLNDGDVVLVSRAVDIAESKSIRLLLTDAAGRQLGWGSVVSRSGIVLFKPRD